MTTQAAVALRFTGRIDSLSAGNRRALIERAVSQESSVTSTVSRIIESVRTRGDAALLDLARELDGVDLTSVEVPSSRIDASVSVLGAELQSAITRAARNIERVHSAQLPRESIVDVEPGVTVERRPDPLDRVGIYAPGGTASYISSVLMCAIPARIAGVREIVMCTPPLSDGFPSPELLAAAAIAGVHRVFSVGGAGAIAAMATGTESIPRVDRIVGPGNAYVAEAKMQLASVVGIDSPAGPSELLVIADESASAEVIAREVVAQAEHDARATVIVIAIGSATAQGIESALSDMISTQSRSEIVVEALSRRGGIIFADSTVDAIELSNAFAPEHLLIAARDARGLAARARNAGSVFVGETSSVAFGDYITGGNHVLPTGGTARWYSGSFHARLRAMDNDSARVAKRGSRAVSRHRSSRAGRRSPCARGRSIAVGQRAMTAVIRAERYVELPRGCDIDLSDNTNLWGSPPSAVAVLTTADSAGLSRYPSAYSDELKTAIAAINDVDPSMVLVGCGSDDVIDSILRAMAEPGDVLGTAHADVQHGQIVRGMLTSHTARCAAGIGRRDCGNSSGKSRDRICMLSEQPDGRTGRD